MKTDAELAEIANSIRSGFTLRCEGIAIHTKLLRSIQIDALRHAREVVEKAGDDDLGHARILAELDKLLRDLELT